MPSKYSVGDVLYINEGRDPHYHIIILDSVCSTEPMYIIVYLSSTKVNADLTTTFVKDEDSFIDRYCWVKYQSAYIISEADLEDGRIIRFQCKARLSTINKISSDILKAQHAPRYVKERFTEWKSDRNFSNL